MREKTGYVYWRWQLSLLLLLVFVALSFNERCCSYSKHNLVLGAFGNGPEDSLGDLFCCYMGSLAISLPSLLIPADLQPTRIG